MELHVKCFSEGVEKVGDKFRAVVRSDMFRNAVFGEHMHNEQHCKVFVGGISFYDDRFIRDPMGQDRCGDERGFQGLEGSIFNPSLERMKLRYSKVSLEK